MEVTNHIENIYIHLPPLVSSEVMESMGQLMERLGRTQPMPEVGSSTTIITPPASGTYWDGQGGNYICTHPAAFGLPARHLIVSTGEGADLTYGGYDEDTPGAASQVDGRANTAALLTDGHEHPAAQWAAAYKADGHTDFHLPSRYDLLMCYLHAPQLFNKSGWYSSSSQSSRNLAWCQDFECGGSSVGTKDLPRRARAVRWIHL